MNGHAPVALVVMDYPFLSFLFPSPGVISRFRVLLHPQTKAQDGKDKGKRAELFCQWLLATFGREQLCSGSGVLDVAGGRGSLSFELHTVLGVQTTTVDPRPQRLSRAQHKVLEARGVDPGAPGVLAAHAEVLFEEGTWSAFAGSSTVVGMHPDQATEPIVRFALQHGLPFAVVPCCVFRNAFSERRFQGRPVRTREDLIGFLKELAPGSRLEWLPFIGANQAREKGKKKKR